jgi:hypothetical protein
MIVNMSFTLVGQLSISFQNRLWDLMQKLAATDRVIFMVAAGNTGGFSKDHPSNNYVLQKWAYPENPGDRYLPQMLIVGGAIHADQNLGNTNGLTVGTIYGATYGLRHQGSNGGIRDMVYASFEAACVHVGVGAPVTAGTSLCKNTCIYPAI